MKPALHDQARLDAETFEFYCEALDILGQSNRPFLVGGAFALMRYTGIARHTKDLDVFVRPGDCEAVLQTFAARGFRTELTFPHWLGKVYHGENILDVIFSSGNGIVEVDDAWFEHAVEETVLGRKVLLCPVEETIWSKAFVMERERYDGADVNHLLRACGATLDWPRLLRRFGPHWRLLLSHLILFEYVYPTEIGKVPDHVIGGLVERLQQERASAPPTELVCRGPLLSRAQYLIDIQEWGCRDARLAPAGRMTVEEVAIWTAAIGIDNPSLCK